MNRISTMKKCMLLALALFSASNLSAQTSINLRNAGFEEDSMGWENLNTGSYEYFAPVDGKRYARIEQGVDDLTQITDVTIEAGKTYTLVVWTRSLLSDSYVEDLLNPSGDWPSGTSAKAMAEIQSFSNDEILASITVDVNPKPLSGAPATIPADDGCNVWIDDEYRMAMVGEYSFYQNTDDDPISDPWSLIEYKNGPEGMAVGQIITSQGLKALYGTDYEEPDFSQIWISKASGSPPNYNWTQPEIIVGNYTDEDPWILDAHLFQDESNGKLYMSWGGQPFRVTEMDPETGYISGNPESHIFDEHPVGTHVPVANWQGDEWTDDNGWFEGPALFKHNDYWYLFGSYGNLSLTYTIRMGRGNSPTGPFYDKDGRDMNIYDEEDQEYGNSFLLGDDGNQAVPGHPHIWEENGRFYMGYDYRYKKSVEDVDYDYNGIRRIYFEDGWPTIWTPVSIEFDADNFPEAIGQKLGIRFNNKGESGSILGVDHVSLQVNIKFPENAKILPLGDSRVEGFRPEHESYRYELWKNLIDNERTFDFIGTQTDLASYPDYKAKSFDPDHEGAGGATSGYILDILPDVLASLGKPDIVLLGIGGNDIIDGGYSVSEVIANINAIIDTIQRKNPYVTVILEQIAPGHSSFMSPELTDLFKRFNDSIDAIPFGQSDESSAVITVDMYTGWSDEYMADEVHYNEVGAKEVADRYIKAFNTLYGQPDIEITCLSPFYRSDKKKLFVYPNPVINGEVWIKADDFNGNIMITLFDISGQIIASKQFEDHARETFILELPEIKEGVYLLSVSNNAQLLTKQLVVL